MNKIIMLGLMCLVGIATATAPNYNICSNGSPYSFLFCDFVTIPLASIGFIVLIAGITYVGSGNLTLGLAMGMLASVIELPFYAASSLPTGLAISSASAVGTIGWFWYEKWRHPH